MGMVARMVPSNKLHCCCIVRTLKRGTAGSRGLAHVVVERWRRQYNEERPHSALGYRTPAEVAATAPAGAVGEAAALA